ncbi:unnamed protein product [Vitrella brassicaformis CCMP3155]|uniref:Homoserine dehydrogenase n=2 Tax=Vitrella brassicaformis TaxID=1169539 RepID=A0A0G4GJJ1_VITBC|nr:unnamed protein product [Vitrella brassicaformis CCMP3155]|eukprot:CEM30017.1 unnamed protein product [Vitrella brassicaformis CCMP3155]
MSQPLGQPVNIGLVGFGTVGGGVVDLLKTNPNVAFKRIIVKSPSKKRDVDIPKGCQVVTDWKSVVESNDVDVVVEVMGGTGLAKDIVMTAMQNGKHVVTANKALLSKHLDDLVKVQKEHPKVYLLYEAAVCGGIPIINVFSRSMAWDDVSKIVGIMNGTTNFIMTEMEEDPSKKYEAVLADAQNRGYAEADPSADVEGWDARSKLCLLAKLAFGLTIDEDKVYCQGISRIKAIDFTYAKMVGHTIKLLGVAEKRLADDGSGAQVVNIFLSPCMVSLSNPIGRVNGVTNVVEVTSHNLGQSYYIGPGAGRYPTANSVVSDILDLTYRIQNAADGAVAPPCFTTEKVATNYESDFKADFYLRFIVDDKVGVIHKVSGLMAQFGVSIFSILQAPITNPKQVPFAIITESCRLSTIRQVCKKLADGRRGEFDFLLEDPFFAPYLG